MKLSAAIAQFKPKKGDVDFNLTRIGEIITQIAEDAPQTDLLLLPETALTGYFLEGGVREAALPAEELLQKLLTLYRERVTDPEAMLDLCLGFYELHEGKIYNSALYATLTVQDPKPPQMGDNDLQQKLSRTARIQSVHRKFFLPTYGVFDEERFVSRGNQVNTFRTRFGRMAILICEDIWHSILPTIAALKGATTLLVPSASPGREFGGQNLANVQRYHDILTGIASEHSLWVLYSGLVGFEGGKGFTGSSQVVDPFGRQRVVASALEETILSAEIDPDDVAIARASSPLLSDLESVLGDIQQEFNRIREISPYRK